MLRSRLYIGMLPVAGLLIAVCLYSIYSYNVLSQQLEELQTEHYAAISKIDQILLATSQAERAISLHVSGDKDLAERIRMRSQLVLSNWLNKQVESPNNSARASEDELALLLRNLETLIRNPFPTDTFSDENLAILLERIEDAALGSIAAHNDVIIDINARLQRQSRTHFYVVLGGIVASVILMGWVAYYLSQRILRPVEALTLVAGNLADNDWETDYTPTRSDEIGKLEIAFVEMTRRLRDYREMTSREIVRTRQRMEICFNNLPHPVLFINADRSLAYQNPSASRLIENLNCARGDLHPTLNTLVDSVFGTGEDLHSKDFDETITFKIENEEHHFLPIIIRIQSEEIEEIECALILQDVTNLRLSDELKSDLVATVSHEIKTPVTSATMALHLLQEKSLGDLNADQEDMIDTAVGDLKRLQRLLEHMLQIARLEQRTPILDTVNCDPESIVMNAIEANTQVAEGKGMQLQTRLEPELANVHVDPKLINIALSNFISNAIKYSTPDTKIEVYARSNRDGSIRFGVIDDGPGVPEEEINHLFDKFYRSSRTVSVEGVGLGLSICKDIIIAHNGSVGCENRKNGGTDFYFTLPSAEEIVR